ncbi:MAG TPA: hypothetical protein VJ997_05730 [Longimicrobiales bacterium]|nr:hypothetical protein [Longimicrobiales bacterium]
MPVPTRRWLCGLAVVVLALAAYGNAPWNGWAWDDVAIVENNTVVRVGDLEAAATSSYWPAPFLVDRGKLWRPLTSAALTLEWSMFGDRPGAFHAINVGAHALVSVLVFLLLCTWLGVPAAFGGAALFAVHPVHTEAVANVVGLSELGAAAGYLIACLLYLRLAKATAPLRRVALLVGIALCYLASMAFKEMGATLPAALVLLEWARQEGRLLPTGRRIAGELPLFALLAGVLLTYLAVRGWLLGAVLGDVPAKELVGLSAGARLLTALSLWADYARLMLFPLDLSADYGPAMRFPTHAVDGLVLLGAATLAVFVVGAVAARRRAPVAALGFAWFLLTILPVSHFLFPAGILLGERTLYLPSVGGALASGAVLEALARRSPRSSRTLAAAVALVVVLLGVRTWVRNPDWRDNEAVIHGLERDHPESYVVARIRGHEAMTAGDEPDAARWFEQAVLLQPNDFVVLTEAAAFLDLIGLEEEAADVLLQATRAEPGNPYSWCRAAHLEMRAGDIAGARRLSLQGLAASGFWLPDLWETVARSYEEEGRLAAGARAREMTRRGEGLYGAALPVPAPPPASGASGGVTPSSLSAPCGSLRPRRPGSAEQPRTPHR